MTSKIISLYSYFCVNFANDKTKFQINFKVALHSFSFFDLDWIQLNFGPIAPLLVQITSVTAELPFYFSVNFLSFFLCCFLSSNSNIAHFTYKNIRRTYTANTETWTDSTPICQRLCKVTYEFSIQKENWMTYLPHIRVHQIISGFLQSRHRL